MRRCVRLVAVGAVASLTTLGTGTAFAGGGDGDRAKTVAPSKPKPPAKCADPAKFDAAVIAVSDMPTGFAELPPPPAENAIRLGGGTVSSLNVPFSVSARASHAYQQGTDPLIPGPLVTNVAVLMQEPGDAPKLLKAYRDAAAMAQTWEQEYVGERPAIGTISSSALSFPKIGAETFALRLTQKFRDLESGIETNAPSRDYIVWRRGPIVSLILASNVDTLAYVKKADSKVSKVLVACPKKRKSQPTTTS